MTRNNRLAAAAVGAVVVAAAIAATVVACQATGDPTPGASTSPTATASASPSPSPTTPDPEAQAVKDAEYAVRNYYEVTGVMLQDPENFNFEDAKKVAICSSLVDVQNAYGRSEERRVGKEARGWRPT